MLSIYAGKIYQSSHPSCPVNTHYIEKCEHILAFSGKAHGALLGFKINQCRVGSHGVRWLATESLQDYAGTPKAEAVLVQDAVVKLTFTQSMIN